MSGSKRGLCEYRGLVNHSAPDTAYSTEILPAWSCGLANLCCCLHHFPQTMLQVSPRRKTTVWLNDHSDIPVSCCTSLLKDMALQFCPKAFLQELDCLSPSLLGVPCNRGRAIRPPSVPPTCARQRHHNFSACLSLVLQSVWGLLAQGTSCSLCMVRQATSQAGLHQRDALLALSAGSWRQVSQWLPGIFCAFPAQSYSQTKGKSLQMRS